jgi:hypothetical protein
LPGRPASSAVRANAADVASSAGSVASSGESPSRITLSSEPWRETASVSTVVSNPTRPPVRLPCAAQRAATRRAAAATGRLPNAPSRSSTWSPSFAAASTSDTAAASWAPSPRATDVDRMPRSGHGPASRRRSTPGVWASTSAEMINPS